MKIGWFGDELILILFEDGMGDKGTWLQSVRECNTSELNKGSFFTKRSLRESAAFTGRYGHEICSDRIRRGLDIINNKDAGANGVVLQISIDHLTLQCEWNNI